MNGLLIAVALVASGLNLTLGVIYWREDRRYAEVRLLLGLALFTIAMIQ